ncbi:MAG: GNAT family N-acetyltransferase [Geminicoccaceae bacterium]
MIRPAMPGDADVIRRVAEAAYHPFVAVLGRAPAPMVADFAAHIDQDRVIVFEQEGTVAGYAILLMDEQRALLDNIAVDPACQRSGIGHALLEQVERLAAELGYEILDLYTNVVMAANISWYEKLGFTETGRAEENGFQRVYMSKALANSPCG